MSKPALNLFPARVSIGTVQPDGTVLMSPEFTRAMSALFDRVGGPIAMSVDDLAQLAMAGPQPDTVARRAAADLALNVPVDWGAALAALARQVAALQHEVARNDEVRAELAALRRRLAGVELLAGHRDPYRVNWERPGRIGLFKANTGAFTALMATTVNKLTLTPPPTGATLTLADGKTFTASNTLTLTANDSAVLNIGAGGTLGSAAYTSSTSYAPAGGGGADWQAGKFGCNGKTPQAAAASGGTLAGVISALVANGILNS